MRFETVTTDSETLHFIDGYEVPPEVFDAFRPSRLFPQATMPVAEAERRLAAIKAAAPAPEEHRGPYFANAINDAHPLKSDALAVHSSQRAAVMARNKRHGINIEYDRMGRPVFRDKGQRKALMKLERVRSMNSYDGY